MCRLCHCPNCNRTYFFISKTYFDQINFRVNKITSICQYKGHPVKRGLAPERQRSVTNKNTHICFDLFISNECKRWCRWEASCKEWRDEFCIVDNYASALFQTNWAFFGSHYRDREGNHIIIIILNGQNILNDRTAFAIILVREKFQYGFARNEALYFTLSRYLTVRMCFNWIVRTVQVLLEYFYSAINSLLTIGLFDHPLHQCNVTLCQTY